MAHVDFKITTWERVEIEDENINVVHEALKKGEIKNSSDLSDFLIKLGDYPTTETQDECNEQMSLTLNNGHSTITFQDDNGNNIFVNGI